MSLAKIEGQKKPDWRIVGQMKLIPSDELLVFYVPDWMKPYLRLSLKRLRRLESRHETNNR